MALGQEASHIPGGRLDTLGLGSNLQVNHDYYLWETPNGRGRLQRLQAGPPANPISLQNLSYTYDAVGNVQTLTDAGQTANFTYDAIGNLLTKNEAGTNYTLQYTDPLHAHAPKVVNGATYDYDLNGNLTGRAGDSLMYDAENRLQSVTSGGKTVTFMYDGDGRRVLRDTVTDTVAYIGPHYEARFTKTDKPEDLDDDCRITVIDIMQVAAQWGTADPLADVNGDGSVDVGDVQQVAGQWRETCHVLAGTTKYYTLGSQRIAMRKAGTLYYLFTDHLGSTSVTYDTTNGQAQTLRYYPWGGVRSGDVPTDRRFTGQRWDDTIGLYDYQARFYDPALGRFTQPGPIAPEPGNPQDAIAQNLLSSATERRRSSSATGAYRDQGAASRCKTRAQSRSRGLDTAFRCAPGLLDRRAVLSLSKGSLHGHIASFAVLPQDLNRYSDTRNNPIRHTDPTGRYIFEKEPADYFTPSSVERRLGPPPSPERRAIDGHLPPVYTFVDVTNAALTCSY